LQSKKRAKERKAEQKRKAAHVFGSSSDSSESSDKCQPMKKYTGKERKRRTKEALIDKNTQ